MAGAKPKYRHLSRNSAHRQALLRNLIDKLFEREHITTTWPKAKEAQRLAEKVITLGIKGTSEARSKAQSLLYVRTQANSFSGTEY
jgi:ribosomal protein L17